MTGRAVVRAAGVLAAVSMAAAAGRPAGQKLVVPGIPVEIVARSFQPGEVLLAQLADDPSVRRVVIRFLGQSLTLEPAGPGGTPFGLFGLDLGLKPGTSTLTLKAEWKDGRVASSTQEVVLEPKEFPSTRLRVAPEMVTPPAEEAERIRREQELVAEVLRLASPDWLAEGGVVSPLEAFEPYPNFGQRRIFNDAAPSIHTGVDIGAPWGTPVKAPGAGRVVLASQLYVSGWTVIIDHGRGVFSYTCHYASILVKRGDLVRKGQVIARVGTTGRSTGPHLHWSIRVGPNRVDPFSLVALPLD
jgi:murein DD-endopeptidase MepM/ murein hydrolase activator NlpD